MITKKFLLFIALCFKSTKAGYFEESEKVEGEGTHVEACASGEECAEGPPQGSSPWPNGVIPYKISRDFSTKDIELICAMMEKIEAVSCIQFKAVTTEATFVDVRRRTDFQPCQSFVGYKNTGARDFFLQEDCMSRNGILHELMHVLGFRHEHLRIDRDRYITINMSNVVRNKQKMFEKRQFLEHVLAGIGYDVKSVLHYPHNVWAIDKSRPTIIAISGEKIQANGLSEKDIMKLNRLYECGITVTTRKPETHTSITTTSTPAPTSKSTTTILYRTVSATNYHVLATDYNRLVLDHYRPSTATSNIDKMCRPIAIQQGGNNLCTTYVKCCKENCNLAGGFNTTCQYTGVVFDNDKTFCHCPMPIGQLTHGPPVVERPASPLQPPTATSNIDKKCRPIAIQQGGNNLCTTYVKCCKENCNLAGGFNTKCQYRGVIFDNDKTFCHCPMPKGQHTHDQPVVERPAAPSASNHHSHNNGANDQTCRSKALRAGGSNVCTTYVQCCEDKCSQRTFTTKCRYTGVIFDNAGTFCIC